MLLEAYKWFHAISPGVGSLASLTQACHSSADRDGIVEIVTVSVTLPTGADPEAISSPIGLGVTRRALRGMRLLTVAASRRPADGFRDIMRSTAPTALSRTALAPLAALLVLVALGPGCARQTHEPFPVAAYLDAPDNLQGNRYTLDAEIDAQLEWREGVGRLLAVHPLGADASARLPVFIADSLSANLMVAQRYRMELTVRHGGLLHVNALEKL